MGCGAAQASDNWPRAGPKGPEKDPIVPELKNIKRRAALPSGLRAHPTRRVICLGTLAALSLPRPILAQDKGVHAIAMHGGPKHGPGIKAFPYVNHEAPKGGRLRLGVQGTFDSLNPLIFKGEVAAGVRDYVYESLLIRSADEPFSLYGHLAEEIILPAGRTSITFKLRREARFSDGTPVTSADIAFSHALLRDKGWPFMRASYRRATSVVTPDDHTVQFVFGPGSDRELPLLIGLMPILPKLRTDPASFEQTTLVPPIGSGPYRIGELEAGRSVTYHRNPQWWAAHLPQAQGRHNFAAIRMEYFRDTNTMFEAFKAGDIDLLTEDEPSRWALGYDFSAVREGRVMKRELAVRIPAPMSALVCNTRRPILADVRIRRALNLLFDAEWINANLFAGLLARTQSFFERSDLSCIGHPASSREKELLGSNAKVIDAAIMDGTWRQPVSDGTGSNRANQRAAIGLLRNAGYELRDGRMANTSNGRPLTFEILLNSRRQERLVLSYVKSLAALGIKAAVRQVDSAQYELRLKTQDFDMIQTAWQSSLSPGNEQYNRWGSASADAENTRNYAGVKSAAVDAMIDAMVAALTPGDFTAAVRAFDRVLLSGHYVIPLLHPPKRWVAHWSHITEPQLDSDRAANAGLDLDAWWALKSS